MRAHWYAVLAEGLGTCALAAGPDPAKATGSEQEVMAQFGAVREQVKTYAQAFARRYFLV